MPTFRNDTERYIDHWCSVTTPIGTHDNILIRFAPNEERELTFWLPWKKLGLTLSDPHFPPVPDTILISGTFEFDDGTERKFDVKQCDAYILNVIVQKGRVKLYTGSSPTGVEIRQDADVPYHYRAVLDWEYAPFIVIEGLESGSEATVHAEIDRGVMPQVRGGRSL